MDPPQTRATIVTLLEQALKSAEAIDDGMGGAPGSNAIGHLRHSKALNLPKKPD
jgi:hypothetical protein